MNSLTATAALAGTRVDELVNEQRLRANMPIDRQAHELRLRSAWRTEQREQAAERQQAQPQPHRAPGDERAPEPPDLGRQVNRGPGLSP